MRVLFSVFSFQYIAITCFILGVIIFSIRKKARQEKVNRNSPIVSAEATVVSKRIHVFGDHSRTSYYITFEFIDRKRLELAVPDDKYGYIVEGDFGTLTYQGNAFISFTGMENF